MAGVIARSSLSRVCYPDMFRVLTKNANAIRRMLIAWNARGTKKRIFLLEARAAHAYWQSFRLIVNAPSSWRGAHLNANDPWNQSLNIGYTVLAKKISKQITTNGMDFEIGFLHASRKGKNALIYDLMELFRQSVVGLAVNGKFNIRTSVDTIIKKRAMRWLSRTAC